METSTETSSNAEATLPVFRVGHVIFGEREVQTRAPAGTPRRRDGIALKKIGRSPDSRLIAW